jgi:hypothetical protein
MLKHCCPTESGTRFLSLRSPQHGLGRVQERSGAGGADAHAESGEVEGASGRQAGRDPTAPCQGPRSRSQPRVLEATGLDPGGPGRTDGGPRPGKNAGEPPLNPACPPMLGQQHQAATVVTATRGVLECRTSLRGVCGWLAMTMQIVVCPETIRHWLHRLGCYLLQRPVERRDDWVVFIDHTMERGAARCLLVLGMSLDRWQEHCGALTHADVQVLMVEVVEHSTGVVVHDQLQRLAARVGVPAQIVTDHGGDLAKGIELFRREHPGAVDTYDVSHKLACLLKAELEPDPRWQEFLRQAGRARATLQQAKGGLPRPPALRTKARYQNLEGLVAWGESILELEHPGLADRLGAQRGCSAAEARRWFDDTVGWVGGFAEDLASWRGLLAMIQITRGQINEEGLHLAWGPALEPLLRASDDRGRGFAERVWEFVKEQGARVPSGRRYVGCSDVIESIFGKYKSYLERSPTPSLGTNVVLFPLLVTRVTVELVSQALKAVKHQTAQGFVRMLGGRSESQLRQELRPPKLVTELT